MPTAETLIDRVEPALSFARTVGEPERRHALAAAHALLDIHRPPQPVMYAPADALRRAGVLAESDARVVDVAVVPEVGGDPAQIETLASTLLNAFVLDLDTRLELCLCVVEDGIPQLSLRFDGPGAIPQTCYVGGLLPLSFEELSALWTMATRGGRIDAVRNGLDLRLKGVRICPDPVLGLETALEKLDRLLTAPGSSAPLDALLELADGDSRGIAPANVAAMVTEATTAAQARYTGLRIEILCANDVPLAPIHRRRFLVALESLFAHALRISRGNIAVEMLLGYETAAREVSLLVQYTGSGLSDDRFLIPSLERAFCTLHGGQCAYQYSPSNVSITASILDTPARALDAWIPGWEVFGEKSRQMLRLLKSGGPTPPEDFLLEGILEEELQRWLLPLFESHAAQNSAHDLGPDVAGLQGASRDRLEKSLTQIKRGKPRKDITRPAPAAETLWAFRKDARSREALGIHTLSEDTLKAFCSGLLKTPPAHLECLRVIATLLGAPHQTL